MVHGNMHSRKRPRKAWRGGHDGSQQDHRVDPDLFARNRFWKSQCQQT